MSLDIYTGNLFIVVFNFIFLVAPNEAQKGNIAIYVGLCVSFAALITVVVIVVVFIRRRNRHHHGMLDGYSSGSELPPFFGQAK